jgi:hypothetical protein
MSTEVFITQQVVIQETAIGVVEVITPTAAAVVEVITAGPQGSSAAKERRHDWTGSYDYLGTAPEGTAESAAAWHIVRLTVNTAGAVTANQSATAVTWTGRTSHSYT